MTTTRYDAPAPPAPTLFDEGPPSRTIQEEFDRFDTANPWVRAELTRMALELVDAGHGRLGIGMLWEVVRWTAMRQTIDPTSTFHLNNNLRSRYARSLMATVPELAGVFETRKVRTA